MKEYFSVARHFCRTRKKRACRNLKVLLCQCFIFCVSITHPIMFNLYDQSLTIELLCVISFCKNGNWSIGWHRTIAERLWIWLTIIESKPCYVALYSGCKTCAEGIQTSFNTGESSCTVSDEIDSYDTWCQRTIRSRERFYSASA